MSDVLIATWLGGGAMHHALRIGRELAERGHRGRAWAPRRFGELVGRLGCPATRCAAEAELAPALGGVVDDQDALMRETCIGLGLREAVPMEVSRPRADVVVGAYLLRSTAL